MTRQELDDKIVELKVTYSRLLNNASDFNEYKKLQISLDRQIRQLIIAYRELSNGQENT